MLSPNISPAYFTPPAIFSIAAAPASPGVIALLAISINTRGSIAMLPKPRFKSFNTPPVAIALLTDAVIEELN